MGNSNFSFLSFLNLSIATMLLIISIITTIKRETSNQSAGKILAIMNWALFYSATVNYFNLTGKIVFLPHLFRTAHIGLLLYMPLSYFYVMQFFLPRKLRYSDLLHLLPVLLYIVDYFPFFMLSASEKMAIYHRLTPTQGTTQFSEGFFMPAYFHPVFRYVVMIGYWLAQVRIIRKILSLKDNGLLQNNPTKVKWIKWLTISQLILFLPPLVSLAIGSFEVAKTLVPLCGLSAAGIQAYFLFSHPGILYGIKGVVIDNGDPISLMADDPLQYQETETRGSPKQVIEKQPLQYLSETTLDKIQLELDKYMQSAKPYLQPAYGLIDLARETHFTPHQVSAFINKRCEMNFYSYINKYRIDYCKQKIVSKEYIDKTLEAISQESGFQSRATFIRAFKTNTGLTPSQFIKELKTAAGNTSI